MTRFAWIPAALGLLLAACATPPAGLAGSEWRPVALGDLAVASETTAFVGFRSDGALVGNSGCNAFQGHYDEDAGALAVGPLAATRMACPEPEMALEAVFLLALADATRSERDGTTLHLFDVNERLATLAQTDWD